MNNGRRQQCPDAHDSDGRRALQTLHFFQARQGKHRNAPGRRHGNLFLGNGHVGNHPFHDISHRNHVTDGRPAAKNQYRDFYQFSRVPTESLFDDFFVGREIVAIASFHEQSNGRRGGNGTRYQEEQATDYAGLIKCERQGQYSGSQGCRTQIGNTADQHRDGIVPLVVDAVARAVAGHRRVGRRSDRVVSLQCIVGCFVRRGWRGWTLFG
mmetsp:Transcript_19013/g.43941  ORF Transcript_19013/g.43941 Transcript_19013/m.43941 type:complete len:211 (-) Transcript_19013:121-753(-)